MTDNQGNREQAWQFLTIRVFARSIASRQKAASLMRTDYEERGWEFVSFQENGLASSYLFLKKRKVVNAAEAFQTFLKVFRRNLGMTMLTLVSLVLSYWERAGLMFVGMFCLPFWIGSFRFVFSSKSVSDRAIAFAGAVSFAILVVIGVQQIRDQFRHESRVYERERQIQFEQMADQHRENNEKVVRVLAEHLSNSVGIPTLFSLVESRGEELVGVKITVTRSWLALPYYSRLQSAQAIDRYLLSTVRIGNRPGYSFILVDHMDNEWAGNNSWRGVWVRPSN